MNYDLGFGIYDLVTFSLDFRLLLCETLCFSVLVAFFSCHKVSKTLRNTKNFAN